MIAVDTFTEALRWCVWIAGGIAAGAGLRYALERYNPRPRP